MPAPGSAVGDTFPRSCRLLTSAEFQAVFAAPDRRISRGHYLLLVKFNAALGPRLGLVVARKTIRLATRRNRIKRVARETFRLQSHRLGCVDVLFLPRRGMDELPPARQTRLLQEAWLELNKALMGEAQPCLLESSSD